MKSHFYISFRPDLSQARPYAAVQCGAGFLHRLLSGLRGFETLEDAVAWSRKFEKESGFVLVSADSLPEWFVKWGPKPTGAVTLPVEVVYSN